MSQPADLNQTVDEAPRQNFVADAPGASRVLDSNPTTGAPLELLEEIARGGMGAILRGRDADIGRDVAVKLLLESHHDRPELARRFLADAHLARRPTTPALAPV